MQTPQIPIITSDYLISLHTMLKQLTVKVDQLGAILENIVVPTPSQKILSAPDRFEVSLSFLAAATGTCKSTIERRITDKKLPMPQANPYNRYRYWFKSDLPQCLHRQIDEHYASTKVPR